MIDMQVWNDEKNDYVPVEVKQFRVQEVIDAVAADGFEHLRGKWFQTSVGGKLTGGCVLAQGAINLSVFPTDQGHDLGFYIPEYWNNYPKSAKVAGKYIRTARPTLFDQLNRFRVTQKKWNVVETYAGSCIVNWNDKEEDVEETISCDEFEERYGTCYSYHDYGQPRTHTVTLGTKYTLETYEDVAQMVKEILWPHRNKIIYLAVQDYSGFTAPEGMTQDA